MFPNGTVPPSLAGLLRMFACCFTAPSCATFSALVAGLVGQVGRSTVTGMLTGTGLARVWPHDRAQSFFSRRVWDQAEVGMVAARAIVRYLLPAGAPIQLVVDDTLFRRSGRVARAWWAHDGSARGRGTLGFGTIWVVVAIVVRLPICSRPIALPVAVGLWRKNALSRGCWSAGSPPSSLIGRSTSPGMRPTTASTCATCRQG